MSEARRVKLGRSWYVFVKMDNKEHLFTMDQAIKARERAKARELMLEKRRTDVVY